MKSTTAKPPAGEFIAAAQRAFRRVARNLRAENARLNLPLITGENGRVKRVRVKQARSVTR